MNKNIRNNLLYFLTPLIGIIVFKYFSTKPSVDQISINYNTALNKENKAANISYQAVNFNFDVKPILSDKCYTCHGPDDKARKANLRLDIEQGFYAALEDNPNHFVIDKNNPNESEILKRIDSENSNYIMPPPESNLKLSKKEKEILKKWVLQGGKWEPHWAYTKPKLPEIPEINIENWASNEIDFFIASKLESKGMSPSKIEEKEILIRRAYFDITGLPPSLDDIDKFVSDTSEDAYEHLSLIHI